MKTEHRTCPICRGEQGTVIYREYGFNIKKCNICDYMYTPEVPAAEEIIEMYYQTWSYLDHVWDCPLSRPNDTLKYMLEQIKRYKPKGKLLEIGFGAGSFLNLAKSEGYEVSGIDISLRSVKYVKRRFRLDAFVTNIENPGLKEKSFDIVVICHTLEHLRRPYQSLENIYRLLKDDGILVLTTPNSWLYLLKAHIVKYFPFLKKHVYMVFQDTSSVRKESGEMSLPFHINFNTQHSLKMMLKKIGFYKMNFWFYRSTLGYKKGLSARDTLWIIYVIIATLFFRTFRLHLFPQLSVISEKKSTS